MATWGESQSVFLQTVRGNIDMNYLTEAHLEKNMMSSTKPKVHNLLQHRGKRTEQRSLQATYNIYPHSSTLYTFRFLVDTFYQWRPNHIWYAVTFL